MKSGVPLDHLRAVTRSYGSGFLPYVLATVLAFWFPYISIGIYFCLWILWGASGVSHETRLRGARLFDDQESTAEPS